MWLRVETKPDHNRSMDLHERRVLVTGASSGIGEAITRRLVEHGASVVGAARRTPHILRTGAVALALDVTDAGTCRTVVDEAAEVMGGLDAVVNAAGITRPGSITHADPNDWSAMFAVNVLGLLTITQAAIPHLRNSGNAQIINISSMSGHRILSPHNTVYAATKHAVEAITKGMRKELSPQGIRVTSVAPGYVQDTQIHDQPAETESAAEANPEGSALRQSARAAAAASGMALDEFTDSVTQILQLPLGVQVQRLEITSDLQSE